MKKTINISRFEYCYGCGVCAKICPKDIISIDLNKDGFYQPKIFDQEKCIECGLCLDVCAFNDSKLAGKAVEDDMSFYAGWSTDPETRRNCSSGGVAFEIAKHLIDSGYKVCAVRYNVQKERAEHYVATNEAELLESRGSKYIPSYTVLGLSGINRKDRYVVIGTPCQIDSIRRYIRRLKIEDNFVLVDFFCHGVPSMLMWKKYLDLVNKYIPEVSYVTWRNKENGWHDSWVMNATGSCLDGKMTREYVSNMNDGDLFYKMFLYNNCLGKACYNDCKYKMTNSSADIRIGDLWGGTYAENEDGVNGVIAFTSKGEKILKETESIKLVPETCEIVTEGQMKQGAKRTYIYDLDRFLLKTPLNLTTIDKINRIVPRILAPVFYLKWRINGGK